jgi:ribonuclease HI
VTFRASVDGASRGNPGPSGAGAYIEAAPGHPAEEHFEALGKTTNNVAEYRALLLALKRAEERCASEVTISSDSLLLVEQVLGHYKVKAIHLKPLHAEALSRARRFRRFAIRHIPREENTKADRLANLGADASERNLSGERFRREP